MVKLWQIKKTESNRSSSVRVSVSQPPPPPAANSNGELELAEQNLQGHVDDVTEDFYKAEYTSSHSTYGFNAPTENLNASAISYGSVT